MATLVLSSYRVLENAPAFTLIGTLSVTGDDIRPGETFTFALDDERFAIEGNLLIVKAGGFDFEGPEQQFPINIQVTGSQNTPVDGTSVVLNVANVNEAPTDILVTGGTIGDNAIIGAPVAFLTGEDPDRGDLLTYMIVDENGVEYDHHLFGISGNQIVVKNEISSADVGSNPVYVKVTDAGGLFHVERITLTVEYVNKAPEVDHILRDVLDGSPGGTVVAVISAQDEEQETLTYRLSETSAQLFDLINNNDGTYNVVVKQGQILRSARTAFQSVVVEVSDTAGNTTSETVALNIIENLEPEANFEFAPIERIAGAGSIVGRLVADDPEGKPVTFTLSNESAQVFQLVRNADGSYNVVVKAGVTLRHDQEDGSHQSFTVTVSDGFNTPFEETFQLEFWDKAPAALSVVRVSEGISSGVIGTVTPMDDDDEMVDVALSAESARYFRLVDNGSGGYTISLRPGVVLDYENPAHHAITLIVSDGINAMTKTLALDIIDEIDILTGTARADVLNGTTGRDIVKGLAGNDRLAGNAGDDRLHGSTGKDILTGGLGRDVFVFDSKPNKKTNLDKIVDFKVVDDSIWLENKIFSKLGKKGSEAAPAQLKKSFFKVTDKAKDKDDYIVYNKKTGKLFYDVDGSGSKAAVEIATLSKKLAMTHKDFFVI
ncbi:calcium-binding protein [Microvirga splendida]|uniref:Cadherin domain-containing protein n=1 Tax=Microvirga splendida TaxID=2795727 RepID=A0ABS0Y457_9HYPH|nr:calcium-binding protein [Microvirga splendida]MBJ6127054.1 hypothetical protein [Microvirga splendida]